jgi:hypothetical protein
MPKLQLPRTAKKQQRKFEKIFPEKELRGHIPNFHIHVSASDLYMPTVDLPILLQENMWADAGNTVYIRKLLTDT